MTCPVGREPAPARRQGAREIDPVEAQDDVRLANGRPGFRAQEQARRAAMEGMGGGEGRPGLEVGEPLGAEPLGQRHAPIPVTEIGRDSTHQDDRAAGGREEGRGARERLGRGIRGLGREEPLERRHLHRLVDRLLLQGGVEAHVDRPRRRGGRDDARAQECLQRGGHGARQVVPLDVAADHRAQVARGVDPVHPGAAPAPQSIGPTAPRIRIGTRSHQALKIAIVACIRPTLLCRATAIGRPVTRA